MVRPSLMLPPKTATASRTRQVVQQPVQSVEIVGYLPHGPAQVAEVDGLERQHHRLPTLLDGVAKRVRTSDPLPTSP